MPPVKPWYVIMTAPGAHGVPGQTRVSQKPFPTGATQLQGPFKTKAQAEKAANAAFPGGTAGSGIAHTVGKTLNISSTLEAFYKNITDGKMWRSLGWLILGIILVAIGINIWMKLPGKLVKATEAAAVA